MSASAFRDLLEAGDIKALRSAWRQANPHLPQPESDEVAEIGMHMARTSSETVSFKYRAYSHRWLTERSMPSQLPDVLKPKAERMYPRVVEGVGISVTTKNELLKPVVAEVQKAMADAVEDAYAHRRTDPAFVRARMAEARERTYRALLGTQR